MDFLTSVLEALSLHSVPLSPDSALQDLWKVDVEFEIMTQSDELRRPYPHTLTRLVLPELRAADYTENEFALRPGEELILLPDPAARARALKIARRWALL